MVTIYDKNGTQRTVAHIIKREGTFLNVATVTVTIQSPTVIHFAVGDYLDYCGWRYKIYFPCVPTRTASTSSCGDAFEYNQVFKCASEDLKLCLFRDLVLSDNNSHFTSLPDVSTFEDVYGIANRIQANMNSQYGVGVWNITVVNVASGELYNLLHTIKAFSVSNGTCLDALSMIYDVWDSVGWVYSNVNGVHTITIGKNCIESGNTTEQFAYGINNGLSVIRCDVKNADDITSVVIPYGNSENMQSRYYNNITYQGHPLIGDAMYIPNLMIPYIYWGTTNWYSWSNGTRTIYTDTNTPLVNLNTYTEPNIGSPYSGITRVNNNGTIVVNGSTYTATGNYIAYPDVRKAYVENSSAIAAYGKRSKIVYFNGSDKYEDVHPSIEGLTIGNIISAKQAIGDQTYVPSTSIYSSSERADEIKSATNPSDSGTNVGTDGKVLTGNTSWSIDKTQTESFTRLSQERTKVILPSASRSNSSVLGSNKITFTIPAYKGEIYITDSSNTVNFKTGVSSIMGTLKIKAGNEYINGCVINFALVENTDSSHDRMYYTFSTSQTTFRVPNSIDQTTFYFEVSGLTIPIDESNMTVGDAYSITCDYAPLPASDSANIAWVRTLSQTFTMKLKQIGFDIFAQRSNGDKPTISMKTGYCAGREFEITNCVYNSSSDDWTITCKREDDNALSLKFPNNYTQIKSGDRFVLLNIQMPNIYVEAKSFQLYNAAQRVLGELSIPNMAYTTELDQVAMLRKMEDATYTFPMEGMYLPLYDADIVGASAQNILIDSFSISEDGINAPTFNVGLKDKKQLGIFDKILKQQNTTAKVVNDNSKTIESVIYSTTENNIVDTNNSYLNLTDKPSINGQILEGNVIIQTGGGSGNVNDVQINGTSILNNNIANFTTQTPVPAADTIDGYHIVVNPQSGYTVDNNTIYFFTTL